MPRPDNLTDAIREMLYFHNSVELPHAKQYAKAQPIETHQEYHATKSDGKKLAMLLNKVLPNLKR